MEDMVHVIQIFTELTGHNNEKAAAVLAQMLDMLLFNYPKDDKVELSATFMRLAGDNVEKNLGRRLRVAASLGSYLLETINLLNSLRLEAKCRGIITGELLQQIVQEHLRIQGN